jgi:hypothetical protein
MIEWLVGKKLFRNENHAIWFLGSVGFLIVLTAGHFEPNFSAIFLIVPLIVYLPPLATSIYKVYTKQSSNLYSRDCIWFNAFMIVAYLSLFFIIEINLDIPPIFRKNRKNKRRVPFLEGLSVP